MTSDQASHRRRWSLRSLLIAVSLLGVLLGWIGIYIRQIREERRIAEMCVKLGASLTFAGPGGWVTEIRFSNYNDLDDDHLRQLARLSHLQRLYLNLSQVTGSGLAILDGFPALRELHVNESHLSDDGIRHLKQLTGLDELRFWGTRADDPRIKEIRLALPNVEVHPP